MIDALTQDVTLPLWLVLRLAAYTPQRLARMARKARGAASMASSPSSAASPDQHGASTTDQQSSPPDQS